MLKEAKLHCKPGKIYIFEKTKLDLSSPIYVSKRSALSIIKDIVLRIYIHYIVQILYFAFISYIPYLHKYVILWCLYKSLCLLSSLKVFEDN